MTVLISLIGEQATPNLLPVLYLKPEAVVLVQTAKTSDVARRLEGVLPVAQTLVLDEVCPFQIPAIYDNIRQFVIQHGWSGEELFFNLTGGTKPMALAAHQLARELESDWVYLQSQGAQSVLFRYRFSSAGTEIDVETLPSLLELDLYLRAHLGTYHSGAPREKAEVLVRDALQGQVDECMPSMTHGGNLEIDLVLRCGNQVGVAEIKTGKKARSKQGIDQLTTAAEQRYLGTYIQKFLIIDRELGTNNRALAAEHHIHVIELPSLSEGTLRDQDWERLVSEVRTALGAV
jgi:Holliday junction resolvase-like predicted endonuclease